MSIYSTLINPIKNGRTDERPDAGDRIGDQFFDTQLEVMFYWDGTLWRRAGGSLDMLPTTPSDAWAWSSHTSFYGMFPNNASYGDHQYLATTQNDKGLVHYYFYIDTVDSSGNLTLSILRPHNESVIQTTGAVTPGDIRPVPKIDSEDVSGGSLLVDVQNNGTPGVKNKWRVYYYLEADINSYLFTSKELLDADGENRSLDTEYSSVGPLWPSGEVWVRFDTTIGVEYDLWIRSDTAGWAASATLLHYNPSEQLIGSPIVEFGDDYNSKFNIESCPTTKLYLKIETFPYSSFVYKGNATFEIVTGGA